jgi:hypothetical protein
LASEIICLTFPPGFSIVPPIHREILSGISLIISSTYINTDMQKYEYTSMPAKITGNANSAPTSPEMVASIEPNAWKKT